VEILGENIIITIIDPDGNQSQKLAEPIQKAELVWIFASAGSAGGGADRAACA